MFSVSPTSLPHRRYAWVIWPSMVVTAVAFWQPAVTALYLVSVISFLRIHLLLPHEKNWIQKIRQQAAELDADISLALLEKAPCLTGYTAQLEAELIHARLLLDAGRDLEAQQRLSAIDTAAMTPKEKIRYQSLKAFFYYQTGDLKAFIRQTKTWNIETAVRSTEIASLKALALQENNPGS